LPLLLLLSIRTTTMAMAAVASQGFAAGGAAAPAKLQSSCQLGSFSGKNFVRLAGATGGSNGAGIGCGVRSSGVRCEAQAIEREAVMVERGKGREEDAFSGLKQVCAVLGTQWGDEGKGKLVDILAQRFDVVARCQVL